MAVVLIPDHLMPAFKKVVDKGMAFEHGQPKEMYELADQLAKGRMTVDLYEGGCQRFWPIPVTLDAAKFQDPCPQCPPGCICHTQKCGRSNMVLGQYYPYDPAKDVVRQQDPYLQTR